MSLDDYDTSFSPFFRTALVEGSFPNQPLIFPAGTYNLSTILINAEGRIISITQGSASAVKAQRITTGSVGAGATAAVVLTWSAPFADANYTPVASVEDSTGNLIVVDVSAYDAASVTVNIKNNDGVNPHTGTLLLMAIHD